MREKLLDLMKNEGLKPSQLAEMLGINPAGISHILAGRNKPGFDLLQKILRRFPRINPDWLMLDSGPMYRSTDGTTLLASNAHAAATPATPATIPNAPDLFNDPKPDAPPVVKSASSQPNGQTPTNEVSVSVKSGVAVERVVIFYDDQTFESYSPTKR